MPPAAPAAPPPTPGRSALRRWFIGLLVVALLLVAGVTGSAWWAWRHPAALPWLLTHLPGLQASGVRGSLASGTLQIDQLDWQLPAQAGRLRLWQLQIDGSGLVLWPRPGTLALLRLDRLQAARAQFDSPPPSGQPAQPPAQLRLPIDLDLQQLRIAALQIDALPAVRQLQAGLQLGADGGRLHRVDGLQLVLETGTAAAPAPVALSGRLQIGTAAPLALQADLQARRTAAPAWQATLAARGPLAALATTLQLRGEAATGAAAPTLQAQATVLPFAPWPLGALQLQTEALDLAALSPRLPQTRLAGRAEVQTRGLDQPAALRATLDNRLPGAWDAGRLPLQQLQLQASGRPDQTDRLTLDRFQLLLGDTAGPAGRISGQGQWQGDALRLQLQIDQLLPARLHRSAAPLRLGGPLQVQVRGMPTAAAGAAGTTGTPTVAVDGTLTGQWADSDGLPVQLRLVAEASASHLLLTQAEARAGGALARLSGQARAEAGGWRLQAQATLTDFDPRPWWRGPEGSAWRRGPHRLQGEASAQLLWRPALAQRAGDLAIDRLLAALDGDAKLHLADSQLAGVPLAADLALQSQGPSAQVQGVLVLGGNRFTLDGQGGAEAAADRWSAGLQAPTLATLAPLRPLLAELAPASAAAIDPAWPSAGSLQATLQTQGRWPALQSQGTLQASQWASAALQLQQASLSWRQGDRSDAPLQASLQAQGLRGGGQQLDRLALTLSGTLADHRIQLSADSPLRPPAWTENLLGPGGTGTQLSGEARGQWLPGSGTAGGRYQLQGVSLQGGARQAAAGLQGGARQAAASQPWLAAKDLAAELQLDAGGGLQALQLAPGRVQLPGTALNWRKLAWAAGGDMVVAAELETIDVASLLSRLQPDMGWRGDLTLGGRIDITSSAQALDADIVLARGQGDLSVVDDLGQAQPLGLTELRLALSAHGGRWQFAQGLVGARIGSLVGAQVLSNPPGQRWPQRGAALQGLLEARVANLGVWGTWVPPGWRLSGALDTVAQFDGTLGAPRVTGSMRGSGLGLRNVLEGVNLTDGQLALQFTGDQARIERFSLQGGDGRLDITGGADLGAQPKLHLQLVAERFRLLGRIDRRIVASGQAGVTLSERRLQVDGGFSVDEGLIDIGRGDAPTLDSDVQVQRSASALAAASAAAAAGPRAGAAAASAPPAPVQVQMQVKIDLGQKLQLRGQGVDTRLAGDVVLSSAGGKLAVNGTVRTVDGRYAAYGQRLEITRGRFYFTGEPGNPRLDVLAIRPNLDVQVGVLIDGQALSPRIRLYSDPELADYDKLSWLVLGRSPDGLGSADTALLQRAAFALLSGSGVGPTDKLMEAIGLTDLSFRQTEGDTRDTIISLGKQLSRRWYVGYERGVHATTGTWQLIYRVAQRFTLRAQSGSDNAVDLIWTWRW